MINERIWIYSSSAQAATDYRHRHDPHQSCTTDPPLSRWSSLSYRYRGHPEPLRYACSSGNAPCLLQELRHSSNASLEIAELSGASAFP